MLSKSEQTPQPLEEVVYLEIGDRTPGDVVTYPDDDLQAMLVDFYNQTSDRLIVRK